jgi:hypothetical protein
MVTLESEVRVLVTLESEVRVIVTLQSKVRVWSFQTVRSELR